MKKNQHFLFKTLQIKQNLKHLKLNKTKVMEILIFVPKIMNIVLIMQLKAFQ
jgi:hypothetical protein